MKFNYEQMKELSHCVYQPDSIFPKFIQQVFVLDDEYEKLQEEGCAFKTPEELINYLIEEHTRKYKDRIREIEEDMKSLFDKKGLLVRINDMLKQKEMNDKIENLNKSIEKTTEQLKSLSVREIDPSSTFDIQCYDLKVNDILYIVSLNDRDYGVHPSIIADISYFRYSSKENTHYQIHISCLTRKKVDNPDSFSHVSFSETKSKLTTNIYNMFVFSKLEDAQSFFKEKAEKRIACIQNALSVSESLK